MSVRVQREPNTTPFSEVAENCCRCRMPTRYWYTPKDVALCLTCATMVKPSDIPSKAQWLRTERATEK